MYTNITDVLKEKNISYEAVVNNTEEIKIKCTSGLHEDRNPSLHINMEKQVFNCFSCGYSGSISKLVQDLGVNTYEGPDLNTKQGFKLLKLQKRLESLRGPKSVRLPEPRGIIKQPFKGISEKTLKDFEVFLTDYYELRDYVCVPVYQNNKLKFIEGRYRASGNSENLPKYLRLPTGVSVSDILFPLDKVKDFSSIILVEGIFDVIKLHELGYTNSLCIFGTNNFTDIKAKILDELGTTHVILMMDGDTPGKLAAQSIQKILTKRNIRTSIVKLREGTDPGVLDKEEADLLLSNLG